MPLGGHPGAETADLARQEGLEILVVPIDGRTRTALTIREERTGQYWHYLEPGPHWTEADADRVRQAFPSAADRCELIVISGSLPCPAAGVLSAVRQGWSPAEALGWGVACGAANAAVWDPGRILREDVECLASQVTVRAVSSPCLSHGLSL